MTFAWLNFVSLNVSALLFGYASILSVMPATHEEKVGEKAWRDCFRFRVCASMFMSLIIVNVILWVWFPLPPVNWPVHEDPFVGMLVGIAIGVPLTPLWLKGMKDAGKETMKPSEDTEMFGGVYRHIRHPQTLGEMPWFIAIAFLANSLFLVLWTTLFVVLYTPIMIHFEEKDLVKRFGDAYIEYQRNTGALIPRLWKKKKRSSSMPR